MSGSRNPARAFSSLQVPALHREDAFEGLSPRGRNILLAQGIRTAEDLRYVAQLSEKDLLRWPRVGKVIAAEIMSAARALVGSLDE